MKPFIAISRYWDFNAYDVISAFWYGVGFCKSNDSGLTFMTSTLGISEKSGKGIKSRLFTEGSTSSLNIFQT